MAKSRRANTRAVVELSRRGIPFSVHEYELAEESDADTYGEAVARELGVDPARLFKTLIATVDGAPVVGIVPSAGRLSLKALARTAGGKRAAMADPVDAERWTGYVTGGISPFGQTKPMPVYVDESALDFETVLASAGRRGLQIELDPRDLVAVLAATAGPIAER